MRLLILLFSTTKLLFCIEGDNTKNIEYLQCRLSICEENKQHANNCELNKKNGGGNVVHLNIKALSGSQELFNDSKFSCTKGTKHSGDQYFVSKYNAGKLKEIFSKNEKDFLNKDDFSELRKKIENVKNNYIKIEQKDFDEYIGKINEKTDIVKCVTHIPQMERCKHFSEKDLQKLYRLRYLEVNYVQSYKTAEQHLESLQNKKFKSGTKISNLINFSNKVKQEELSLSNYKCLKRLENEYKNDLNNLLVSTKKDLLTIKIYEDFNKKQKTELSAFEMLNGIRGQICSEIKVISYIVDSMPSIFSTIKNNFRSKLAKNIINYDNLEGMYNVPIFLHTYFYPCIRCSFVCGAFEQYKESMAKELNKELYEIFKEKNVSKQKTQEKVLPSAEAEGDIFGSIILNSESSDSIEILNPIEDYSDKIPQIETPKIVSIGFFVSYSKEFREQEKCIANLKLNCGKGFLSAQQIDENIQKATLKVKN